MNDEMPATIIPVDEEPSVLKHFERRLGAVKDSCCEAWNEALQNQRFVSGGEHQWDPDDFQKRKSSKKATFTINDIALAVNAFAGKEITTRFQQTVLPRSEEDGPWSNLLREIIRQVRDQSFAEQVESDKFRDLSMDGYAWLEWAPDYLEDPRKGKLVCTGLDLWDMVWDATARQPCLRDREWDARGKFLSIDEYLALFPKHRDAALGQINGARDAWISPGQETINRWPWLYRANGQYVSPKRREIFVCHYQWREREPVYLVVVQPSPEELMQNPEAMPREELMAEDQFLEYADQYAFQVRSGAIQGPEEPEHVGPKDGLFRWRYREAYIAGKEVISEGDIPVKRFTRIPMTGFPAKTLEQTTYFGWVNYMKDPQRFQNEVVSLAVSYLQRGPKGPLLVEPGAFEDDQEAARQLSQPTAMIRLKRGGRERLEWGPDLPFPSAISAYLDFAQTAVWRPTGFNPATLGNVEDPRRVSGTAYSQMIAGGERVLAYQMDSLRLYRRLSGELILAWLPILYDEQSLGEVVGPAKAALIPPREMWETMLARDVVVEEVLSTKSEQEAAWEFGSRQGTWEKLLMSQLMPPEVFVKMIPSSWLPEPDKKFWLDWLAQRMGAQQAQGQEGGGEGQPQG